MERITGWLLYLCYKLQNHYIGQISLRNWLWFLIVVPPVTAFFRRLAWVYAILLSLLGILMFIGIEWARRLGYLVFEPASWDEEAEPPHPIAVDEQIVGWASGLFAVGKKTKYVVNATAQLSYACTREHVVMARLKRTRFLLFARSLAGEVGCWYVFFMPHSIQRVETGYIRCGSKARPGLALSYSTDERRAPEATVYLAFSDVGTVQRVLADLCALLDAQYMENLAQDKPVTGQSGGSRTCLEQ